MKSIRLEKLRKFKEDKEEMSNLQNIRKLATADLEILPEREDFINELSVKITELKEALGNGIRISDLDEYIVELGGLNSMKVAIEELNSALKSIEFPDYPSSVEVKGLQELTKILSAPKEVKPDRESAKLITKKLEILIKAVETNKVKQGQKPSDYLPMRRVMKVGQTLMYDDSFYTGGGGGSSVPTKSGSVPVVNPDGSPLGDFGPVTDFDYLDITATSSTLDTLTYKNGGVGGSTVRTLTVTYASSGVSKISDTFDVLEFN